MTYDSALEWADDSIPKSMFDSFDEWYNSITEEFGTPALTDSDRFRQMALESWNAEMQDEDEIPERGRPEIEVKEPQIDVSKVFAFGKKKELTQKEFEKAVSKSKTTPIIVEQRSTAQAEPVIQQPIVIQSPRLETQRVLPETGRAPEITSQKFFTIGAKIKGAFRRLIRK